METLAVDRFTDILYDVADGVARITINRPRKLNAFTPHSAREMTEAFLVAGSDRDVRVIVLTGAGERAFSAGGDVDVDDALAFTGAEGAEAFEVILKDLYRAIRNCLKPVIARVDGYAIAGGNHLAYLCDLTIASDRSVFGQAGPKVASPTQGWIVSYLVEVVGVKRAKEIWMLCRRHTAQQAYEWGLVNAVVPAAELDTEVARWCDDLMALSPTVLKVIKKSIDDAYSGVREQQDRFDVLKQVNAGFFDTGEPTEGTNAFLEKRAADFSAWA